MSGREDSGLSGGPAENEELERLRAENEALQTALEKRVRWRRVLAVLLVVLTSLGVIASSVAVWAHQVVFDTDRFMETVGPALEDPRFYVLVGDRASESVLEALAIEDRLTEALEEVDAYLSDALIEALDLGGAALRILENFDRPSLADLAPPIAGALEARIDDGVHAFFSSEAFVSVFPELVRGSHGAAIALARNELAELPNVYVEGGEVRLNLLPFIGEALRQLTDEVRAAIPDFELPGAISERVDEARSQLEEALQTALPEDFGQVTVMSEAALSEVQAIAVQLDRYVWAVVLATLALIVVTIVVAPDRRRTAIHLGIGVLVAVVAQAVIIRRLEAAIVEEIVDPQGAALAADVVGDALAGLRNLQWLVAIAAVLVAVVAYLAGRPAWFTRLTTRVGEWTEPVDGSSRLDQWLARHSGPLQVAGVLVALAAFFLMGLDLVGIVVIGLLLGGYLWAIGAASRRVADRATIETVGSSSVDPTEGS